jgi:hypothetical protein
MSTPLSPAAQAVLDAFLNVPVVPGDYLAYRRSQIAATIRAAVERAVPEPPDCGTPANDYVRGLKDRQRMTRFRLLSIAAELEEADA